MPPAAPPSSLGSDLKVPSRCQWLLALTFLVYLVLCLVQMTLDSPGKLLRLPGMSKASSSAPAGVLQGSLSFSRQLAPARAKKPQRVESKWPYYINQETLGAQDLNHTRSLASDFPNLPLVYLAENVQQLWFYKNDSCARFPFLYDLRIEHDDWQVLEVGANQTRVYLLAAYLDDRLAKATRKANKTNKAPHVKISAMLWGINPKYKLHCQFWFVNQSEPVIVPVGKIRDMNNNGWTYKYSYRTIGHFLYCYLPELYWNKVPKMVSIVNHQCDQATNALKVHYEQPVGGKRKDILICAKGLSYPFTDFSRRLIEWLELHLLYKADVHIYSFENHPNVSKVMDYYRNGTRKDGKVSVTHLHLPDDLPNTRLLQHLFFKHRQITSMFLEHIVYHDCFYRHLYQYNYIGLVDTDELVMPVMHRDYPAMIESLRKDQKYPLAKYTALIFRAVYYFDGAMKSEVAKKADKVLVDKLNQTLPPELHMMSHYVRSQHHEGQGSHSKCFFNTDTVSIVFNHYPLECHGRCWNYHIPTSLAQLNHYRANCTYNIGTRACDWYKRDQVADFAVLRHLPKLVNNTRRVRVALGL